MKVIESLGGARGDCQESDGTIKSALGAVMKAIRSAYGPAAQKAAELADGGHDPTFLDRTSPLLDFSGRATSGCACSESRTSPPPGRPCWWATTRAASPTTARSCCTASIATIRATGACVRWSPTSPFARAGWPTSSRASAASGHHARPPFPLLAKGELIAVFPEGLRGVGKLYRERYRMARFGRGGFVRLSSEAQVPLLPVAIVGAEEIHPIIGKITSLAEPLGLPYIPITPTFPWLGPLGLLPVPTKWTIQIGAPIPPPAPGDGPGTVRVAEAVRTAIDGMIADLLVKRRSILFG